MAENETRKSSDRGEVGDGPFTILTIPDEQVEAVTEFLASLRQEESDVSGHMISRALGGGLAGGGLNVIYATQSNCQTTVQKGGAGFDEKCTDTDKIDV